MTQPADDDCGDRVPYVDGGALKTRRVCHKVCHKVRDLAAEHEDVYCVNWRACALKLVTVRLSVIARVTLQPAHDSRLCDEQRKQCIEHAKIH